MRPRQCSAPGNSSRPSHRRDRLDLSSGDLRIVSGGRCIAAAITDYREKQKALKRAAHELSLIALPTDVATIDTLIAGLNRAAKVHSFPENIRRLRSKLLQQRASIAGVTSELVASAKGKLVTDDATIRLCDVAFEAELASQQEPLLRVRDARCLLLEVAGDGAFKGELRWLRGALLLERKEYARVEDSSAEYVLQCPTGKLLLTGLPGERPIVLDVAPRGDRIVVAVHRLGEDRLVALASDTDHPPHNELTAIEQLEL